MKVLVAFDNASALRPRLEAAFPGTSFCFASNPNELEQACAKHSPEVAFTIKTSRFLGVTSQTLEAYPSLRWVHIGGSGYEHLLPWDKTQVTVSNSVGVLAPYLAETLMGSLLALNGQLFHYRDQQRQRLWQPLEFRPLSEQTLLIVGLGHIGQHVAKLAQAHGMRVLAIRQHPAPHPFADQVVAPGELLHILPQADVVSLHLRLNEATRHLFDARTLASMRPGSLLCNTARGGIVEEQALVAALQSGHLRGAYLDVFHEEPLPASSPLWDMEQVFITPHAADLIEGWAERFATVFVANLKRYQSSHPLQNVVR